MADKSENRGRRQMSGRLPVGRTTVARYGAIATFVVLIQMVNVASVMGAPGPVASLSGASVGEGTEVLPAPLRQSTTEAADLEMPTDSGAESEGSRISAIVAVVNRQGIQGAESLQRVSAIAVPNLVPEPEFVVDARVERAAEANAAATATAVAAADVALSVQATVEAQAASDASAAAALAVAQQVEADAAASAAVAADATATARAEATEAAIAMAAARETQAAAVAATREAEASVAAATARADALAAAAEASKRQFTNRVSLLLIALIPMVGGVLGLRFWRNRKEPFVLKAIPVSVNASAHA